MYNRKKAWLYQIVNTILKAISQMKYKKNKLNSSKSLWLLAGATAVAVGGYMYMGRSQQVQAQASGSEEGARQLDQARREDNSVAAQQTTQPEALTLRARYNQLAGNAPVPENILFVIGDSQTLRSMGKAFKNILGSSASNQVSYWGIEGTTPKKILVNHVNKATEQGNQLIAGLMKKPPIIVIQLGDNGINNSDECMKLIMYINSFYDPSRLPLIVWSGPFPLCIPASGSRYVLPSCTSDPRCLSVYQARKLNEWTPRVNNGIRSFSNVYFVSPYEYQPFVEKGQPCFTDDGVHISKEAMSKYVDYLLNRGLSKS
jgi:hypothetical protein